MTTTLSRVGRNLFAISSALAVGISALADADDSKDTSALPPIFAHPAPKKSESSRKPVATPAAAPKLDLTMSRLISDGLPKFDAKLIDTTLNRTDSPSGLEQAEPVIMAPFTVFDARVLELTRAQNSLLDRVGGTDPVYRHIGKDFTSELTFVDLAVASNWAPFSKGPPPTVRLRFTISW